MLDDLTFIPKPRFALFDVDTFHDEYGFNLVLIRKLIYGLSSHWKLMLIALVKDALHAQAVKFKLIHFGINIEELILIDASYSQARLANYIAIADIVYAPCLRTLPVKFFDGRFRQPKNSHQAVEALVYFSNSVEDFNYETYYSFLSRTDH